MAGGVNDFERVAKLNEMSKTLKAHGFAQDALEAIEQANDIYPEYGGGSAKETPAAPAAMPAPQSKEPAGSKETYEQLSTYLKINEDFKKQATDQLKTMAETMAKVTDKMNEIIKTINELEAKITAVSKAQSQSSYNARQQAFAPREEPRREERHDSQEREEPMVSSAPQKEPDRRPAPAPEPHHEGTTRSDGEYANQRTGGYQPGDVSIEKMFYMGKK